MISTAVPPRPNTMTVPKVGSSASPRINSRALAFTTMACTMTPDIRASGREALARAKMSAAAVRTASALVRLSTTPPTSDLCTMSRELIFSTTVAPCASRREA